VHFSEAPPRPAAVRMSGSPLPQAPSQGRLVQHRAAYRSLNRLRHADSEKAVNTSARDRRARQRALAARGEAASAEFDGGAAVGLGPLLLDGSLIGDTDRGGQAHNRGAGLKGDSEQVVAQRLPTARTEGSGRITRQSEIGRCVGSVDCQRRFWSPCGVQITQPGVLASIWRPNR